VVFSTLNPNQVVVAMGTNNSSTGVGTYGLDASSYIYLNAPDTVDSIAVGDFNGDGHPDIAVASGSGGYAGIYVYLSEYSAKTGDFLGFSDPLFTPLPSLVTATNDFYFTSTPVTKLVAGDFLGSGVESLAVLTQQTELSTKDVFSVLLYLNGESNVSHPGGTGYFYADFSQASNSEFPFLIFGDNSHFNPTNSVFEVTAVQTFTPNTPKYNPNGSIVIGGSHDVIIEAGLGANGFSVLDDSAGFPISGVPISFGKVDTNRQVGATFISSTNFAVQNIAVTQDQSNLNTADLVALSQSPVGFLETLQGQGDGTFLIKSGTGGVDNAGIPIGGNGANPVSIVAIPNTSNSVPPVYSNVAVLDYVGNGGDQIEEYNIQANLGNPQIALSGAAPIQALWLLLTPAGRNTSTVAFDAYYPEPVASSHVGSGPGVFGFVSGIPLQNYVAGDQDLLVTQPLAIDPFGTLIVEAPFKVAGNFFIGGNGGNSQSGPGGTGGSFGQSLTVTGSGLNISGTGTLSVVFPMDPSYEGVGDFAGGTGGNGSTHGGAGGSLIGVSVSYEVGTTLLTGAVELTAGTGGQSLTGAGGNGGAESQLFIVTGDIFAGGAGGIGVVGGSGGSVLGNPQTGLFTTKTNGFSDSVEATGGSGALGILAGGTGGSIINFTNEFPPVVGGNLGTLLYEAGAGGSAVAGHGGAGGSVNNSSPSNLDNHLTDTITLMAGAGGNGTTGGGGGNVTTFVQSSTINEPPENFTVIGGAGGNGALGNGGNGGTVSGIVVSASGSNGLLTYNKMVAGPGGTSQGAAGGTGGSIMNSNTASVASDTQNVSAAGAGGSGLTSGGNGGSVVSVSMDAGSLPGSTSGKVVVFAGDGGTSDSVQTLSNDPLGTADAIAFSLGGVNGPGGAGGNILNFTQPASTQTHTDLIAGNGGDTLAHSVIAGNATKDNSGPGGSIVNTIKIEGSIGNSDPNVPIISYNNIFTGVTTNAIPTGPTKQDFINNYILAGAGPMDDSVGNEGLVAGSAGRVEGVNTAAATVASTSGVNGSVSNVHAANIMSMIAGNVDQVDSIQNLSNFGVLSGGILGANKVVYYDPFTGATVSASPSDNVAFEIGQLNYLNSDGHYEMTPLPGGGSLVDGAIIAKNLPELQSERQF
jgi:hypothetical protein